MGLGHEINGGDDDGNQTQVNASWGLERVRVRARRKNRFGTGSRRQHRLLVNVRLMKSFERENFKFTLFIDHRLRDVTFADPGSCRKYFCWTQYVGCCCSSV